jgi:catechol 2,3-dioxygenase-like lactoylglutathione lyase family enzyme
MSASHPFKISGLGEIAIRCGEIDRMARFYRDTLGLSVLSDARKQSGILFFALESGMHGHTSVLALFAHDAGRRDLHPQSEAPPVTGAQSSLHHIALSLPRAEQEKALAHFDAQAIPYRTEIFDWIGWRGVFLLDPEGNTVELVCADAEFGPKG